jgi:2-phosphosulfolactate phosphatase
VIGAGSRKEFREEDQMCCAWIAEELINAGYQAESRQTDEIVERWSGAPPEACLEGNSARYLRRTGQLRDLEFVLQHINDVECAFVMSDDEVIPEVVSVTAVLESSGCTEMAA